MPFKDPDYYRAYMRKYMAERRKAFPEADRESRRRWKQTHPNYNKDLLLRRRHAASLSPRTLACDICGDLRLTVWDHCHDCGEHRGWLCGNCNAALGFAGDNPDVLERMAAYVRRHRLQEQDTA
jgi:hypothetical protein